MKSKLKSMKKINPGAQKLNQKLKNKDIEELIHECIIYIENCLVLEPGYSINIQILFAGPAHYQCWPVLYERDKSKTYEIFYVCGEGDNLTLALQDLSKKIKNTKFLPLKKINNKLYKLVEVK